MAMAMDPEQTRTGEELSQEDQALGINRRNVNYHSHDHGTTWFPDGSCPDTRCEARENGGVAEANTVLAEVVAWLRRLAEGERVAAGSHSENACTRPHASLASFCDELARKVEAGEAP